MTGLNLQQVACQHCHRASEPVASAPAHRPERQASPGQQGRPSHLQRGLQLEAQRRGVLGAGAGLAAGLLLGGRAARAEEEKGEQTAVVTDVVFLEVGLCPEGLRQDRAIGDASALCRDPKPLGRLVLGLFGQQAPSTVAQLLRIVQSNALALTTVNKVIPGEFVVFCKQGPARLGLLKPPELQPNEDVLNPSAFRLGHRRPGTVSLNLAGNDDDEVIRRRRGYQPSQFLITTGPGPAPALDGQNIVFGRLIEGFEVLEGVARVPVFRPSERVQAWNQLAKFIGDDRADRVRTKYGQPLKAVVITGAGVLSIREPFEVAV